MQDNYAAPIEPTATQTFSLYGVTDFTVQYWAAPVGDRPGGTITGNQNVWRTVTFPAVTTSRIRVVTPRDTAVSPKSKPGGWNDARSFRLAANRFAGPRHEESIFSVQDNYALDHLDQTCSL